LREIFTSVRKLNDSARILKEKLIMRRTIALATIALALIPVASFGATKQKAKTTPIVYVCQKCHMKFTAAQAKIDHYKDPMDGGKLFPIKTSAGTKTVPMKNMNM
jgi:hypothetical protein